jgi:uncharacterized protein
MTEIFSASASPSLSGAEPDSLALSPEDFDALDAILDDLRERFEETPQWEFCEGFMAALIVSRRAITEDEYFPVLLDAGDSEDGAASAWGAFADAPQQAQFLQLWQRRWQEIVSALDIEVQSLDDERAFHPEVMDVRGAVAALPEAERTSMQDENLPAFAQVWAVGFMYAVESWPDEWQPPRDKEARKLLDAALECLVALTEDDADEPTLAVFDEAGPPSVSVNRFNAFADAVWAVYDLRALWSHIGPRVATVHRAAEPGRNDACPCGSGKKYKKCHGA